MNGQEAVLFPVSLSLSILPEEADAGTALTLKAVAECPEQYDLSGDPVLFLDATGHEVGRAPLAALEGNDFGAEITVTAPIELGEYGYSIVLMPPSRRRRRPRRSQGWGPLHGQSPRRPSQCVGPPVGDHGWRGLQIPCRHEVLQWLQARRRCLHCP